MQKIAITGLGIVTPIGLDKRSLWRPLIDLCQLTERFSKTTTDGDNRRTRSLSDAKINKKTQQN